jgi:hypothetical protein
MTPEKIIELAQSVGLTLPKRGDYFFINHEDLGRLLMAERNNCSVRANVALLGSERDLQKRVLNAIQKKITHENRT